MNLWGRPLKSLEQFRWNNELDGRSTLIEKLITPKIVKENIVIDCCVCYNRKMGKKILFKKQIIIQSLCAFLTLWYDSIRHSGMRWFLTTSWMIITSRTSAIFELNVSCWDGMKNSVHWDELLANIGAERRNENFSGEIIFIIFLIVLLYFLLGLSFLTSIHS